MDADGIEHHGHIVRRECDPSGNVTCTDSDDDSSVEYSDDGSEDSISRDRRLGFTTEDINAEYRERERLVNVQYLLTCYSTDNHTWHGTYRNGDEWTHNMPHAPTSQAQQLWQRQQSVNDHQNSYGTVVDDVYESHPDYGRHADYMPFEDFGHVENGGNSSTDDDSCTDDGNSSTDDDECPCHNTFKRIGQKYQERCAPTMVSKGNKMHFPECKLVDGKGFVDSDGECVQDDPPAQAQKAQPTCEAQWKADHNAKRRFEETIPRALAPQNHPTTPYRP